MGVRVFETSISIIIQKFRICVICKINYLQAQTFRVSFVIQYCELVQESFPGREEKKNLVLTVVFCCS